MNIQMTQIKAEKSAVKNDMIRYSICKISLGYAAIALCESGICAVLLGDEEEKLRDALFAEFPESELKSIEKNQEEPLLQKTIAYLENPRVESELPLDIRGTEFQRSVWQALQKIPAGETRTYAMVAKEIGKPAAARAVGAACGSNRLALLVPCHRVVPSDPRKTSHYRWGHLRKEELLKRESTE
jgi:AraC family transcriptional regulator, regulatory protein of adaptative response / methylated-DNA-[protein]-cysteine methyltransferase